MANLFIILPFLALWLLFNYGQRSVDLKKRKS